MQRVTSRFSLGLMAALLAATLQFVLFGASLSGGLQRAAAASFVQPPICSEAGPGQHAGHHDRAACALCPICLSATLTSALPAPPAGPAAPAITAFAYPPPARAPAPPPPSAPLAAFPRGPPLI